MLETLREDFSRIPDLLTLDPPPQPEREERPDESEIAMAMEELSTNPEQPAEAPPDDSQLGLF
jgi:hypothetical protein